MVIHYNSSKQGAEDLISELASDFPEQKFITIQCNLANGYETEKLIPQVVSETGQFDLLVNNASVFKKSYLIETTVELMDEHIAVNLKAPFILMRDFANICKKGNIINLVDTRISSNKSNFAIYSLSKKALWDLTRMAALELAPDIRVNAIAPGITLPPEGENEKYLSNLAENIPMKRPGGLDPVLKSLDYIIENDYLTGQLIFADGGENLGFKV